MPGRLAVAAVLGAALLGQLGCLPCRAGFELQEDGTCVRTVVVPGERDTAANEAEATTFTFVPVPGTVQPGSLSLDPFASARVEVWNSPDVGPDGPDRANAGPLQTVSLPLAELADGNAADFEAQVGINGARPSQVYFYVALTDTAGEISTVRAQEEPTTVTEDGPDAEVRIVLDEDEVVGG